VTTEKVGRVRTRRLDHRLAELAALFLRLGVTAFGGLAVHIAMMEEEVVRKRKGSPRKSFSTCSAPRI
jgi:chromate transport protein ChrA